MKLISRNVRGIRACLSNGFSETLDALYPDVLCIQETKLSPRPKTFQEGQ